jgi:hypothetical protein
MDDRPDVFPLERETPNYVSASTARCFEAAASRLDRLRSTVAAPSVTDEQKAEALIDVGAVLIECARGIAYAVSEVADAVANRGVR